MRAACTTTLLLALALPACTEPVPRQAAPSASAARSIVPAPPSVPPRMPLPGQLDPHPPVAAPRAAPVPQPPSPPRAAPAVRAGAEGTADGHPPNWLPLGPGDGRAARPAHIVPMQGQVIDRRRDTPARLVRRIVNVAANHNLAGLNRFLTPAMARRARGMAAEHAARFWRQIDRYADAAANGFTLRERAASSAERKLLELHTRAGLVLNPVVVRDRDGWLFERL